MCGNISILFFLFLPKKVYCGYSFEVPQQGTSNEYPQPMFSWRRKISALLVERKSDLPGAVSILHSAILKVGVQAEWCLMLRY